MHIFWIRMISQKPDSIESNTNSVAGLYEEKKNEWDATKQIEMFKIQRICIDVAQPIRNIFKSAERPKIGLNLNSEVEPLLTYVFLLLLSLLLFYWHFIASFIAILYCGR